MTRWKPPDKTLSFNTWGELEATGAAGDVPPQKNGASVYGFETVEIHSDE